MPLKPMHRFHAYNAIHHFSFEASANHNQIEHIHTCWCKYEYTMHWYEGVRSSHHAECANIITIYSTQRMASFDFARILIRNTDFIWAVSSSDETAHSSIQLFYSRCLAKEWRNYFFWRQIHYITLPRRSAKHEFVFIFGLNSFFCGFSLHLHDKSFADGRCRLCAAGCRKLCNGTFLWLFNKKWKHEYSVSFRDVQSVGIHAFRFLLSVCGANAVSHRGDQRCIYFAFSFIWEHFKNKTIAVGAAPLKPVLYNSFQMVGNSAVLFDLRIHKIRSTQILVMNR